MSTWSKRQRELRCSESEAVKGAMWANKVRCSPGGALLLDLQTLRRDGGLEGTLNILGFCQPETVPGARGLQRSCQRHLRLRADAAHVPADVWLVSELFSQTPQQLSFYSWYGSARLFRFRVPPATVLLRWLLQVSRGSGPLCSDVEITVHFRYGAPPVINPLNTSFPDNTSVPPSFQVRMLLSAMLQSNASVNVSHPASGDWFVAAHLPPSPEKIQVKGFVPSCAYIFQPDMLVLRAAEISVLEPDMPLPQTLFLSRSSYLKVFVPEFTQELLLELQDCASNGSQACPVRLAVGSVTLPSDFRRVLSCTGHPLPCRLLLHSPPWDRWLQVTAESLVGPHVMVAFNAVATLTACRPWTVSTQHHLQGSPNQSHNVSNGPQDPNHSGGASDSCCLMSYPVLREDMDVVSVRFRPLDRVSVVVWPDVPSVLQLYLNTGMDSGGSLTISLRANKTMVKNSTLVVACVNAASPFLSFNTSHNCTTAFFQGHPLTLSATSRQANLIVPFPETENWYLSLQLMCPKNPKECEQDKVHVEMTLYLVPCVNDCGPYGQCLLLRRHGYLYAGCSCKAGWRGWSCTDNSTAQTATQQTVAALLLTLSNLVFLAPITVSVQRAFLVEAFAYTYTMFFSTFYHACDQPGEAVLCILNYDTLQYCDFLGSVVSIWVTILCMARLKPVLKYVLFLLGTLVIAMSLQLDRRGAWNMMGPCLFALVVMVSMWVYRCGRRCHCYPTSWQRWAFYLLPGISMATVAVAIYTFMMTSDNYYYTHSLWHVLVAGSVAFLLPPCEEHTEPWACVQRLPCHYQICRNDREELYAVT
ncbi:post-GPI attachment to proteins factor 6 isoform X1 [Loxodonta africana]|uniref:post-GPI attachment to proteins factor 6 isoform X1 n=1 Tax=Loxodonta africana TaxID=9785 RepID=UPI000C813AF1|nr:post-GPI attachment to proteins factor 6 isoform X2 [Loxodonta africana]